MIFCISDLHLCDQGPRDLFWNRGVARFYRFLDFAFKERAKVYILGDLLDWWQCNLGETLVAYKFLLPDLEPHTYRYVWGNHDDAFASINSGFFLSKMPMLRHGGAPFTEVIGGKTFAFLHGHEADPYCRA